MQQELIGMKCRDSKGFKHAGWKVFEVLRDDGVGVASQGCGQYMSIIFVW
jgi:hypothetical protein